jgi:hypothetical protein
MGNRGNIGGLEAAKKCDKVEKSCDILRVKHAHF